MSPNLARAQQCAGRIPLAASIHGKTLDILKKSGFFVRLKRQPVRVYAVEAEAGWLRFFQEELLPSLCPAPQ